MGVLGSDTKDMRAKKDETVKAIHALIGEIESYDGGNIEDLLNRSKELADTTQEVKSDVETGHKRLEELRKALADAIARIELEKNHRKMKAEREAKRLQDEMARMLSYNDTQLSIIRKIIARLEALYVDEEKRQELEAVIARTDTAASKNDRFKSMDLTAEHKPEIEVLKEEILGIKATLVEM